MMETGEEQRQARRKAMKLLERMDRTEKGLTERLEQAGFSPEAVRDAVAYVKGFGYINDDRYAVNFITCRIHEKSRQKIFQELYSRGIGRDTAEAAWDTACETEMPDERELLRRTVEKRCAAGSELDEKEMRRLYGFLSRRGFRSGEISSVLEEMEITFCKNYGNK